MHRAHLLLPVALVLLVPLQEIAAAKAVRTEFDRVRTPAKWQISRAEEVYAAVWQ